MAAIDMSGNILIDNLVKPTILIPPSASAIHRITNIDVANAPDIIKIVDKLTQSLKYNRSLAIYNADFDIRILRQSFEARGRIFPFHLLDNVCCIMELYATFNGDFDEIRQCYRWVKLSEAANSLNLEVPSGLHRAKTDAELTRRIIKRIAGVS